VAGDVAIGIVTGLASEVACLARQRRVAQVVCAGASAARARALAGRLADAGCAGLVSFGLAGGLDPALATGALLLPGAVLAADGRAYPTDEAWRRRLIAACRGRWQQSVRDLAGCDVPVGDVAAKTALFASTRAAATDMESHAVAEVAASHALPLLVVRAIADPACRRVPPWLEGLIDADGRPRLSILLARLAAQPGDIVALARLGRDAKRALATLRGVAALAGPRFAFDA
jgi:adenosylhomocysteine nucleosidase